MKEQGTPLQDVHDMWHVHVFVDDMEIVNLQGSTGLAPKQAQATLPSKQIDALQSASPN